MLHTEIAPGALQLEKPGPHPDLPHVDPWIRIARIKATLKGDLADLMPCAYDEREQMADRWACDTLLSENHTLEFLSGKPEPWEMERFAENHKIHPAIAAEVCNRYADKKMFAYSYLRMKNLFPSISDDAFRQWTK
jgi:hypothetical protein